MGSLKNTLLVVLISCVSGCGGNGIGTPESPVWFGTASLEVQNEYFKQKCIGFGFQPDTNELANCIMQVSAAAKASSNQRLQAANASLARMNCQSQGGSYNGSDGSCTLPKKLNCKTEGTLNGDQFSGTTTCDDMTLQ